MDSLSSAGAILEGASRKLTSSITGDLHDIDLLERELEPVLKRLKQSGRQSFQDIYIFDRTVGKWCGISLPWGARRLQRKSNGACTEVAVVDVERRLVERYSITIWRRENNFIEARNSTAPVKKVRIDSESNAAPIQRPVLHEAPIDAVYTWVNSSDPAWRKSFEEHFSSKFVDRDRFSQSDELRYSLRALVQFAPWIRTIYILSNCPPPSWFVRTAKVVWVPHEDVIPEQYLPTFNSHAIETFLHRIPNISENFIYLNDDFFVSDFVKRKDFFSDFGTSVSRLEPYGVLQYLEELCLAGHGEEWQHAAVNGMNIIWEKFGTRPTQLHRHAPYAFKRSVLVEMEKEFAREFHATRLARLRSRSDLSIASFLYHHYALSTRRAVEANDESMIVRHTNYVRFETQKLYRQMKFFCVNDGGGSGHDLGFKRFKHRFLSKLYPFKSEAEL
ncbi:stealth conserved region 3 domain-containing protein [Neorhizobium sp. AL 9.2.2]|uniref:stealth conserved region 3 domain-containing protein n=1 Tax=Neorhizobium sp. AL 9.2.2 TaxID=2712894 RepID=UPI001573CD43|nr:stealth conserved region 3 domain-containing protein [Neorhizobium sp. AL 9.2.2]NSY19990.1 hypothetical protein [Neorhizobium sp. AL 9.2.2]